MVQPSEPNTDDGFGSARSWSTSLRSSERGSRSRNLLDIESWARRRPGAEILDECAPRRRGHRMRRRELLLAAATAGAWKPVPAAVEIPRIGFVQAGLRQDNQSLLDAFRDRLSELGWSDGGNIE